MPYANAPRPRCRGMAEGARPAPSVLHLGWPVVRQAGERCPRLGCLASMAHLSHGHSHIERAN